MKPDFKAQVLPVSAPTDMFYTNKFAEKLKEHYLPEYQKLFG